MRTEYFSLVESPYNAGKYVVQLDFDTLPEMVTNGSFNVLPSRLLSLSYAQYLRFCRDIVGGEIKGKGSMYPVVYFEKNLTSLAFVRLLNSRMEIVMWEREHPNWREHQEFVQNRQKALDEARSNNNVFNI